MERAGEKRRVERREEKKKEDQRRERVRRERRCRCAEKEDAGAVEKSRFTVFFQ